MTASMRSHFSLPLSSGTLEDCSLPCAADNQVPVFFDKRHRRYLRFWTGGWAVACCVCALFTITTFLVDLARFAYPVRPILYMAMCYLMISVVYMIGEWSSPQRVFIYISVWLILWYVDCGTTLLDCPFKAVLGFK
ncbi:hypothetical protein ANCDUO_27826 [Ancylostoma duodenale]|uniref:Frizzled/Smoothened 7TM domain-containing protein n=1 Tax=Ancylostoma duodenale TaxID=51022 RepID=A0A0C2FAU1_9BILA|nr:hypothetical protein ANCDUO_27826 [Ancylostoma duodenale]